MLSVAERDAVSRKRPSGGRAEVHVEHAIRFPKSMVVSCLSREISQNKINQKNSSTGDADGVKE